MKSTTINRRHHNDIDLSAWDIHNYRDDTQAPFTLTPYDYADDRDPDAPPPPLMDFLVPSHEEPAKTDSYQPRTYDWWVDRSQSLFERGFTAEKYEIERAAAVAAGIEEQRIREAEWKEAQRNAIVKNVGAGYGEKGKGVKRSGKTMRNAPTRHVPPMMKR